MCLGLTAVWPVSAHDGCEIVAALQRVRSLHNAVLDPLSPCCAIAAGSSAARPSFCRIAFYTGQPDWLRGHIAQHQGLKAFRL